MIYFESFKVILTIEKQVALNTRANHYLQVKTKLARTRLGIVSVRENVTPECSSGKTDKWLIDNEF